MILELVSVPGVSRTADAAATKIDRLHFPKCPQAGHRPAARRHAAGVAVLAGLLQLARDNGRPFTRAELATPLSSYRCRQCKWIVDVTLEDWLRS